MNPANDNVPLLDTLMTPDAIAARIEAASGVHMTGRTVWEKARRIGVARKIGRSMLISTTDIPELLKEEKARWRGYTNAEKSTGIPPVSKEKSSDEVLALLRKNRLKSTPKRKSQS